MKTLPSLLVAAALTAAAGIGHAQDAPAPGFYVGAGGGWSNVKWDEAAIAGQLSSLGYADGSVTSDREGTAWRVFGGYRVNGWLAVEAGYTDYGNTGWSATITRPAGALTTTGDLTTIEVDALLIWPVMGIEPFLRLGVAYASLETSTSAGGAARAAGGASDDSTRLRYGAGAQMHFGSLGVRLDWTRTDGVGSSATGGKMDADTALISVLWRF
jgi:OOP family OmpA-OmpF porin